MPLAATLSLPSSSMSLPSPVDSSHSYIIDDVYQAGARTPYTSTHVEICHAPDVVSGDISGAVGKGLFYTCKIANECFGCMYTPTIDTIGYALH